MALVNTAVAWKRTIWRESGRTAVSVASVNRASVFFSTQEQSMAQHGSRVNNIFFIAS